VDKEMCTFVALAQTTLVCDYLQRFTVMSRTSPFATGNSEREPNVLQCDALRWPEQRTIHNMLTAPGCLCQSEQYSRAFREREQLREKYLGARFPSPALQEHPLTTLSRDQP
jgi:hypothetical protein